MLSKAQRYWLWVMAEHKNPFPIWRNETKITLPFGQGKYPRCTTFNKSVETGMITRCAPISPEHYMVTIAGRAALEAQDEH